MLATVDGIQEMALEEPASTLLDLPDPCLVAVLRCCANDQRCLFSAARAHSRLHQAAVLALRSITAVKATQQQAHSMLQYLEKHGQHLDSISISGDGDCTLALPLPGNLQLKSVQLDRVGLQPCLPLQPGYGLLGVLGPAAGVAALKQLRLTDCTLRDSKSLVALAAAMWQLPEGLQHLCIRTSSTTLFDFPAGVCRHLQQFTHLELTGFHCGENGPPAAAYSTLTASSKLAHLDISSCELPADVWQHIFPAGRQLPHLHYLNMACTLQPSGDLQMMPTGSTLVSCCPSLQSLDISDMQYSAELLATLHRLTELTGLSSLYMGDDDCTGEGLEVLSQLTGLQELILRFPSSTQQGLLLQLTQLKQLTALTYEGWMNDGGEFNGPGEYADFADQAPDGEPVWRQVLRLHLDHSDPEVAQQAAAALAE